MLLRIVIDALFAGIGALTRIERPRPHEPAPSPGRVRSFRDRVAWWTKERGLTETGQKAEVYEGVVGGARVRLRPGLEGSRPAGVEITIDLAHDVTAPELVTREATPQSALAKELSALLRDTDAGATERLRSIAIVPNAVRLRFAPLAEAELFDDLIEACAEILRRRVPTGHTYRA